jgi:hypothetical protein
MLGVVMSLCAFIAQATTGEDCSRWLENDLGRLMRVAEKWLVSAAYRSTSKDGERMEDPSSLHYEMRGRKKNGGVFAKASRGDTPGSQIITTQARVTSG